MNESQHTQRGQALVILVFALIALLAILGLAVDGGTFLLEERRMQNAADAAALAGTHKLAQAICNPDEVGDDDILAEVNLYAERNGVVDPSNNVVADYVRLEEDLSTIVLGRVGAGYIPPGAAAISTSVTISRSTYFMTLLNQHATYPSAGALAVTGPARAGSGMRPFGVPLEVIQDLEPGGSFTIDFDHAGGDIYWAGTREAQHRGWMNFGYVWNQTEALDFPRAIDQSGDADTLREWMEDGWEGVLYSDCFWSVGCRTGDYVHAKPGTNSTAICAAPEAPTVIFIPIYDEILEHCATQVPEPRPACPTQGGEGLYHIVGFTGIRITECSQGGGTITAEVVETIIGEGIPSVGLGTGYGEEHACEMHTQVVILWK